MNKIKGFNIIVLAALTVFTLTSISSCGSIYNGTIMIVNEREYPLSIIITQDAGPTNEWDWNWATDKIHTQIEPGETKGISVSSEHSDPYYYIYIGVYRLAKVYVLNGETVTVRFQNDGPIVVE